MRNALLRLAAVGAIAALVTGCGSSDDGGGGSASGSGSGKPFRIAVMQGVTGDLAQTSADFLLGVNAAVKEVNAHGGAAGRQIKIDVLDTQSDPTHAVSLATKLVSGDNVPDMIVPGGYSAEALAVLPLLADRKVFSMSPASSPELNDPSKYPNHFGVSPAANEALHVIADSLKSHSVKRLAVMLPADAFGDGNLKGVQEAAKQAGAQIVGTERPDPKSLDLTVDFQRMMSKKPDAIFADMSNPDATARIFDGRRTAGALDVPLIVGTNAAATVPARVADAGTSDNCEMPTFSFSVAQDPTPDYLEPLANAIAAGDNPQRSSYAPGLGYDTIRIAALALERTKGDSSADALSKAMLSLQMPKDYSLLYPGGTTYTAQSHFPQITAGSRAMIPCTSSLHDGYWVTKK